MENAIIPGSNFKRGDIVWAKIAGYPWWPGEVVGYRQAPAKLLVAVNFIGDKSHAYLAIPKVVDYKAHREKNSKTKRKDLLAAIKAADEMAEGYSNVSTAQSLDEPKKAAKRRRQQNLSAEESTIVTKSGSSKKLKTLEDASEWLQELIGSDKLRSDAASTKKLLTSLEIIKEKIPDHKSILKNKIGINLNKIMELYEGNILSGDTAKKIEETLEILKDIVMKTYFGSDLNSHKSNMNVRRESEIEEVKMRSAVEKEESAPLKDEFSFENSQESEMLKVPGTCLISNFELQTNVCHVIAKLLEEVPPPLN
eukprot:TRINITY_DN3536_c0_g6_i1.p1 TRINITY_DN3536_c0_g6~~TRINITY_DN3536_c0_g6_i1.p1  ORF type:complete len:346 (-),score=96.09 TRINITY_DN3536_c0_g6_i1:381-1310(-)